MQTIPLASIKKELVIGASQQTAFEVFTEQMDLWWPRTHHVGSSDMTEIVVEPFANGRWYTKHVDGREADIGYVHTYQPYDLFVLIWLINGDFKLDRHLKTEVVTQFIAEGPKSTRVKFEHRGLDKLGNGKAVESMDQGWGTIMGLYKNNAEQNYSTSFEVPVPPEIVFKHINNVSGWWSKTADEAVSGQQTQFEGSSSELNDEFILRSGDRHYSKQKLIEWIPDRKVVWLITESKLNWIKKDKEEWTNMKIIFELIAQGNKTVVYFMQEGLNPTQECFSACSKGWDFLIKDRLFHQILADAPQTVVHGTNI